MAVTARELAADDRPSVNLTLVVDRSGSMDIRNRLGLVKGSMALLAESLRPDDTVSVVALRRPGRAACCRPRGSTRTSAILAAVDRLYPRRQHQPGRRPSLGYEQARSAYRPGGINVVVLCSDGVANVGMTGPDGITARIAEEGRQGIHLVTVGYGMGNYNDHLMEQLADQGDGFYRYVDTYEEAQHLYVDELTSLLAPVADDARTQVEFDPELVSSYRLVGYDNRAMDDELVRRPVRRRRRARRRPPRERALRGAAGPRRRPGHADRHRPAALGLGRDARAGQRRGAVLAADPESDAERLLRPRDGGRRPRRAGQAG